MRVKLDKKLAEEGNTSEHIASVLVFSRSSLFGRKDVRAAYDRGLPPHPALDTHRKLYPGIRDWRTTGPGVMSQIAMPL